MIDPSGAIVFLLAISGIGLVLNAWLRAESGEAPPVLADGWSFLLGAAAVGLALHLPLAIDGRITHASFMAVALAGALAWCWIIAGQLTGRRRLQLPAWIADLPRLARLALLIVVGSGVVHCMLSKIAGYDARTIYALKARVLYNIGSIEGEDFNDPTRVHFNPTYPMALPLLESQLYWSAGSYGDQGLKFIFLSFSLALASVLASQNGRFENKSISALTALLFLLTPIVLSGFEGAGLSGSADVPAAALIFAGVMEVSRWLTRPSWRPAVSAALLLGAAAATKAEGTLWIVGCGAALAIAVGLRRVRIERPKWRSAELGIGLLVALLAMCGAVHLRIHPSGYYLSYLATLDARWLRLLAGRPPIVLWYVACEFFRVQFWNLIWPCVFGSLLLLKRGRLPPHVWFWRLTAAGMAGTYFVVLIVTPLHVYYQLMTSVTRLMLHFYPLAVLIMSEQMAASGWTKHVSALLTTRSTEEDASLNVGDRNVAVLPPAKAA